MRQKLHQVAATLCVCTAFLSAQARDRGYWKALSTTARSITGDLSLAEEKLTINYMPYTIAQIRTLTTAEVTAVFDQAGSAAQGTLYRLFIPAAKRFLHKNTLCGIEDTQWMITTVNGKTLQVAFFSGTKMPTLTADAVANSTTLCGTYTYTR